MDEVSDSNANLSDSSGNFYEDRRAVAIEVFKKMMGDEGALGGGGLDAFVAEADSDAIRAPLIKLMLDFGMGEVWSRPGLDSREKSLVTLPLTIATRQFDELKAHMKVALRNGLTVEQIRDVLIHSILYVGFPAVVQSHKVLAEVIEEERLG